MPRDYRQAEPEPGRSIGVQVYLSPELLRRANAVLRQRTDYLSRSAWIAALVERECDWLEVGACLGVAEEPLGQRAQVTD